jgi:hypothetical protein
MLNVSRKRCREPRPLALVRGVGQPQVRLASVSAVLDAFAGNVNSFALVRM